MIGGLARLSNMGHGAMASKAARELGEGNRVNVRVRRVGGEDTQAGTCNGRVEVGKGIVGLINQGT